MGSSADSALGGFALRALARRPRQHGVFRRDPTAAAAAHPRRNFLFHGCRTQDARVADAHQRAAFGILEIVRLDADGPQLGGVAAVEAHERRGGHPNRFSAKGRRALALTRHRGFGAAESGYSTVTVLARLRGWSTSLPSMSAIWYASNCSGMTLTMGESSSSTRGTQMM